METTPPTQRYEVRLLVPDEWALFRDIRLEALSVEHGKFGSSYADESSNTEADWRGWLNKPDKCVVGLFDGDQIIGITAVIPWNKNMLSIRDSENWAEGPHEKSAFAKGSYLRPAYRDTGLSLFMHRAILEWVIAHLDYRRVIAAHRASNSTMHNILLGYGFSLLERKPFTWVDNTEEDVMIYMLDLDAVRAGRKAGKAGSEKLSEEHIFAA